MALCLLDKCGKMALVPSESRSNEANSSTKSMWMKRKWESERDDMRKVRSHVTWNRYRCRSRFRRCCACSIIKSFCPILDIYTPFPQHEERCALKCCYTTWLINTFVARTISCHIHGCRRRCLHWTVSILLESCSKSWNMSWILYSANLFFLFTFDQKNGDMDSERKVVTAEWSLINHRQNVTHLSPCWCVLPVVKFVAKIQLRLVVVTLLKIHW